MDWRAACTAVIPCLNEEATIGPLVEEVRQHLAAVFVVDDGSLDQTARKAAEAGSVVLKHAKTQGKGLALQTGLNHARRQGYLWSVLLDGDGQHSPADIPSFLQCAQDSTASLIVGNRMSKPSRIPFVRRYVNCLMSWQLSRLTGESLPDSQCGFRLINLNDWATVPITATHFEVESEVLVQFAKAGLTIEFIPIQVIYKAEQSKIHPLPDTVRWLRWLCRAQRDFNRR